MPGLELELWVPQFHLGTPAAHASNAVPPFQVVTPAPFLPHLSLIIKACCLHSILMPAEKFVDNPWTFGPTGWQILRRDGQAIGCFMPKTGGGSGIRTHDTVARIAVFKTAAFVHSAIPPLLLIVSEVNLF